MDVFTAATNISATAAVHLNTQLHGIALLYLIAVTLHFLCRKLCISLYSLFRYDRPNSGDMNMMYVVSHFPV